MRNRNEALTSSATECDYCHGNKGRNLEVVHILKFPDLEALRSHLAAVFTDTKYCIEFYTNMWTIAHQIYGGRAKELYAPLWLVYLEAHGVKVIDRAEAIMKHRGHVSH
jgi:hypothetical protein